MKKVFIFGNLFALLAIGTMLTMGQYTGSNDDVAYLQSATASSVSPGSDPMNVVDSTLTTNCEIPGAAPAWIQVELWDEYYIDGFGIIFPNAGELATAFTLQVSTDGAIWTDLGTGTAAGPGTVKEDVTPSGKVKYVRLLITAKDAVATVAEFFVYGDPADPPNAPLALAGSGVTNNSFVAHWEDLTTALGYYMDISTSSNFSSYFSFYENLDVGDAVYRDVINLSPGTTYYYRLRAYNNAGTSASSNIVSVSTSKFSQSITFSPLPAKIYGDADFVISATASSGLPVTLESTDESVATVTGDTVTVVGVGTVYITASQEGNFEYNPATPVNRLLEVSAKSLTVSGTNAMDKVYDGTTGAVLSGAVLMGVIGGDDVTLQGATTGTFAQAHVGMGILVTPNMTLGGADKDNYALTDPTGLTANITEAELTVTDAVAQDKVYDGNTNAVVSGATLTGVVSGDNVTLQGAGSGTFAQSGVGNGIEVSTSMSVTGSDITNYTFTPPAGLTADITPKGLTIAAEDKSREACESNPELTIKYTGFISGEGVSDLNTEPDVSCAATPESPSGNYDIVISGATADNYSITFVNGSLTVSEDASDPVLTVKNITVQLDQDGNGSIAPEDVVVSAVDNCSIADTTVSKTDFTTDDIGETVISVTVMDNSGNSNTQFAVITVVGTISVDNSFAGGTRVYPNPTNGKVEFNSEIPADGLKVMDMTGKTIISRTDLKLHESFDLSDYSNGIYIFQVKFGERMSHIKVIKK